MSSPASPDAGALTTNISELSLTSTPETSLLSLSRELRDEIYGYLLRAGSLEFLRTSRQIHDEAKERLFHEAVFRVKVGFTGGRVNNFPTNWRKFERFHFHIFLGLGTSLPLHATFRLFDRFTDLDGTSLKRQCLVSIQYDYDDPSTPNYLHGYPYSLSEKLGCLKNFASVVVEFVDDGLWEPWRTGPHPESHENQRVKDKWMFLEEQLRPVLGTGRHDVVKDDEQRIVEQRLVFHPLQYHSALAGKEAGISEKD